MRVFRIRNRGSGGRAHAFFSDFGIFPREKYARKKIIFAFFYDEKKIFSSFFYDEKNFFLLFFFDEKIIFRKKNIREKMSKIKQAYAVLRV